MEGCLSLADLLTLTDHELLIRSNRLEPALIFPNFRRSEPTSAAIKFPKKGRALAHTQISPKPATRKGGWPPGQPPLN